MVATEEACNSRSFSWLVKSCLPNPHQDTRRNARLISRAPEKSPPENHNQSQRPASISSLPDDLLLECLSRVSTSSLPSVALVCRRWSRFVASPEFYSLRRANQLLRPTLVAVAVSDFGVLSASHRLEPGRPWKTVLFTTGGLEEAAAAASHARLVALDSSVYVLGRTASMRYHAWSETVSPRAPMLHPRKKFAAAAVSGRLYVAGGCRSAAVEEYDPAADAWRVVSEAPKKRYGCVGAAADGVFYVIGGLKIGDGDGGGRRTTRGEAHAHAYASSMDLYDVGSGAWLRSRGVPGGGCVVAACGAGGGVYVLASHAVDLSFWRCEGRRSSPGAAGFGEWCRLRPPPVPAQVRLDGTVRFCCVGVGDTTVALVQVVGSIDDLLRRSGRSERGHRDGLVLLYDSRTGEWNRGPDLPEVLTRAGCVSADC